jgi:hypothetical protein
MTLVNDKKTTRKVTIQAIMCNPVGVENRFMNLDRIVFKFRQSENPEDKNGMKVFCHILDEMDNH